MADGLESTSRSTLGIAGLNGTNTDCSQLKWTTITKGKRSRKAVGRSKLASETPKRVGEYSGSDTDKFDEPSLADGLVCVPIKKRRHLLHSPSRNNQQSPPEQESPSLHSEKFEQLSDNNGLSCNQSLDLHSDIQRLSGALENNSDDTVNLSGIALLATAACFDSINGDLDNVKQNVDVTEGSTTLRKCNDSFTVTIPVGEPIQVQGGSDPGHDECASVADPDNVKHDVTEKSLTLRKCNDTLTVTIPVGEPIQVQERLDPGQEKCASLAEDSPGLILAENNQGPESISVSPKIDRCFWDLNKVMEEWEVAQDDLVVRKSSVVEASIEERCSAQSDSENNGSSINHVSLAPIDVATASFNSKVDDNEHVRSTLLKNYEQQMSLLEVSQMKDAEEDSQKTSELSEDRTVLVEDSVRKTCETMDVAMLPKSNDLSTSEISNADQLAVCGGGDDVGQEEKAIVTDAMDTNDASDCQDHPVSKREIVKTSISLDSVKTLVDDDHGLSDATQNISELQVDYDSPYEDGELRLPALYSCDRNEIVYDEEENECVDYESDGMVGDESDPGDHPGSEVVEAGSEGSQAPEKKYSVPAQQISETVTSNSSLKFKEENNVVKLLKPEAKKLSNQGSGTTDELPVMPLVQDNNDSMMRRERNFDHANRFNSRGGSYPTEFGLTREKSQQYNVSNMSSKFGGDSFSRSERGRGGGDRSMARRGSSFGGHRQTGGYNNWNYKDSTNRYQYRGSEDNWPQTKTRNAAAADSIDKYDDVNSYEHDHQPLKFSSKGIQRPFFRRRSPVDRDDYYGDHGGFTLASSGGYNNNKRGSFGKFSGRGFGRGRREEEYVEPAVDDAVSSGRFSGGGYLSRGEQRSFSPSNRAPHVSAVPSWKSRSRSRTRSPHAWQSQRERSFNTRRCSRSRSPEFRPESSIIERTRGPVPYQKRNFNGADYTERFISPPKARFSPTRNNRWVNDNRNFANPPLRHHHRRSPPPVAGGAFRQQTQKFGGQPGRFGSAGDNNEAEENCGDRKLDQRFGLVDHNVRHSGTSNILRRPRHDVDDTNGNCEDDDNSNINGGRRGMPSFGGADYEERFSSPQHNNNRWSDERDLDNVNNNNNNNNDSPSLRHGNSSPSGMMRRVQRPKEQDDYFRPSVTRPGGRFTTNGGGGDWGNNGRRRNLE